MSLTWALIRELRIAGKYAGFRVRESINKYLTIVRPPSHHSSKFAQNLESLRSQQIKAKNERSKRLNWKNWFKDTYQTTFSMQSAKMAMLESCAISHAAEVAAEMNIDVPNISFVEASNQKSALGEQEIKQKSTVTAFIEAPNVSDENFAVFVERIRKECPVARQMGEDISFKRKV